MNLSGLSEANLAEWITAAAVFVVGLIVARIAARSIRRVLESTQAGRSLATVISRLIGYLIAVISFVLALNVLELSIGPLLGALGLGGLVVALAFQEIVENVVAGVLIHVRRPFVIGDEIESNGHVGRVIDVNARTVVIDAFTGEKVFLPNSDVLGEPIVTRTANPSRRLDLAVGVAYGTDLARARSVIAQAVEPLSTPGRPAQVHLVGFGDSSIDFVALIWHGSRMVEEFRVRTEAVLAVKAALDAADITIPFPQRSLWFENGLPPDAGDGTG